MKVKRHKLNLCLTNLVLIFLTSFQFQLIQGEDSEDVQTYTLDFIETPQIIFNSSFMTSKIHVRVNESQYKVSVVLEKFLVSSPEPVQDNPPSIFMANSITDIRCKNNIDYTSTSFDDILYRLDGDSFVNITKEGNWTEYDTTQFVVTIYYEMNSCADCPSKTFCCEGGNDCKGEPPVDLNEQVDDDASSEIDVFKIFGQYMATGDEPSTGHQRKARCINMNLRCNSHPNCGMTCNADETDDTCNSTDCGNACFWNMSFIWTALLAIVFFIMAPTVVVFLICYHRQLTVVSRRPGRGSEAVTVNSPANDLPPQYDELQEESPPPCFCCATAGSNSTIINSTSVQSDDGGGGLNNVGFIPEDESMPNHKSILCSCRSNDKGTTTQIPKINGDTSPIGAVSIQNNSNFERNTIVSNNIDNIV